MKLTMKSMNIFLEILIQYLIFLKVSRVIYIAIVGWNLIRW